MLVEDLVSAYDATMDFSDGELVSTMTESETARFIHDWAERLLAACSSTETLIRPPPLNGGGLFARED